VGTSSRPYASGQFVQTECSTGAGAPAGEQAWVAGAPPAPAAGVGPTLRRNHRPSLYSGEERGSGQAETTSTQSDPSPFQVPGSRQPTVSRFTNGSAGREAQGNVQHHQVAGRTRSTCRRDTSCRGRARADAEVEAGRRAADAEGIAVELLRTWLIPEHDGWGPVGQPQCRRKQRITVRSRGCNG
jgi:hypothetical protein